MVACSDGAVELPADHRLDLDVVATIGVAAEPVALAAVADERELLVADRGSRRSAHRRPRR